jgi:hypothetical protein
MEQSPFWEAISRLRVWEIPRHLWNPKVHVHEILPLYSMSLINPVHFLPPFLSLRSVLTLSSNIRLDLRSGPLSQNLVWILNLHRACYIPCPSHSWSDHNIWWRAQVMKLLFFVIFTTLRLLSPVLQQSNLFYSLILRDQVSPPPHTKRQVNYSIF